MSITGWIRYVLDPFQRDAFEAHARRRAAIIPRCGGARLGDFLPHEGTRNIALALIGFARLAHDRRFILSEERTFPPPVQP